MAEVETPRDGDAARLEKLRRKYSGLRLNHPPWGDIVFFLRLLDSRDAALRAAETERDCIAQSCASVTEKYLSARAEVERAVEYLQGVFKATAPQCEPFGKLLNLCTQIDNLIAGQKAEVERLKAESLKLDVLATGFKLERDELLAEVEALKHDIERALNAISTAEAEVDRLTARNATLEAVAQAGRNALRYFHSFGDETEFRENLREALARLDAASALDALTAETERLGLYPWQTDAAAERATIVAWLRECADQNESVGDKYSAQLQRRAAANIERGEHAAARPETQEGE